MNKNPKLCKEFDLLSFILFVYRVVIKYKLTNEQFELLAKKFARYNMEQIRTNELVTVILTTLYTILPNLKQELERCEEYK
jgi:hypothetical protein